MRAILVCVDYADLLAVTLPYNRHHFDDVAVVTSSGDTKTLQVAREHGAQVIVTDLFFEAGAVFNKWKALEYGLSQFGRQGWLCLMDADVLWPKQLPPGIYFRQGYLYTPLRRMFTDTSKPLPPESEWGNYPIHRNIAEWAGYSQIFHASDPVLGPAPWHEINWRHAGGADSFFQQKWPADRKVRPRFEVLHIGEAGVNWCGRASAYLDGRLPADAGERREQVRRFIRQRRANPPDSRYAHERY